MSDFSGLLRLTASERSLGSMFLNGLTLKDRKKPSERRNSCVGIRGVDQLHLHDQRPAIKSETLCLQPHHHDQTVPGVTLGHRRYTDV